MYDLSELIHALRALRKGKADSIKPDQLDEIIDILRAEKTLGERKREDNDLSVREAIRELAGMYRLVITDDLKSTIDATRKNNALDMAIELLEDKAEPEYPVCECCGKAIDHINTSHFNRDGTDSEVSYQIQYEPCSGCVSFTTDQNWTDYELTDEERKEGIRCPYCGKYPFDKNCEIDLYEPVEVLMWVTKPHELFPGDMEEQWERKPF